MCCIDGQENKYSVLNECSRMLKYNIINYTLYQVQGFRVALDGNPEPDLVHATGCKQPTLRLYFIC
jgi:hypothetical protein